jgi:hypothetical protein
MRNIKVLVMALAAVFAFSAVAASSSFAVVPKWFVSGVEATGNPVDSEGLLELSDTKAPIVGLSTIHCEGVLIGTVSTEGADLVTEVLTGTVKVGTELSGTALKCTAVAGCEPGTDIEVWVDNMPWHTQLELVNGVVYDTLFGSGAEKEPGYEVLCLVFGVNVVDLCEGKLSGVVENMVGESDVLTTFTEAVETALGQLAQCTLGGAESGVIVGEGLTLSTEAGLSLEVK